MWYPWLIKIFCEGTIVFMAFTPDAFPTKQFDYASFTSQPDATTTRRQLGQHALCCFEVAEANKKPSNIQEAKAGSDASPKRERLDENAFDMRLPLSNFRRVSRDLTRSGRPLTDKGGIQQLLDKIHPGKSAQYQNNHTAIFELRDENQQMDDPKITALNKKEVLDEEAYCKLAKPPIEYHRFTMQSKQFQSPEKIDDVIKAIDQAVADGKKVSIHCFHGSDRTGLISAAYLLNHDPKFHAALKNNPDKAYKLAVRNMIENGCEPASYTMMFRSLKQYVDWKHDQLHGKIGGVDGKNPMPLKDLPLDAKQQARVDDLAKSMFADKHFARDPVSVYRRTLKSVSKELDPATNSAFYKALRQKYQDGPAKKVTPGPGGGSGKKTDSAMLHLPDVTVVAA